MNDLTYSEKLAIEQIQEQSDGQLEYTIKELNNGADFDFVDFIVVASNRVAVPVKKTFFIDALLCELEYRSIENE